MKKILKRFRQIFRRIRPKKIVDTLFMGYVILIIIPIQILGVLFTGVHTYHLLGQTKNNAQHSIEYAEKILGNHLDFIYNTSYNFMSNDNILGFEKYNDYSIEQAMSASEIGTTLKRAQTQSEIVDDVFLYYKSSRNVLSATQSDYSGRTLFGMENEELDNFLIANNGRIVSIDTVSESGLEQSCILYIKAIDKKRVSGNIYSIFLLNNELIKDAIHLVNTNNAGYVILLDDAYNCLIYDGNDKFKYTDEMRNDIKSLTERRTGEYIKANIDGRKTYLLTENVALSKIKMCFIVSRSHYDFVLWTVWGIIFILSLFIIVMSIFVAHIYSRNVYRPIGNIINLFKPSQEEYGEKSEFAFFEDKLAEIQTMQNKLAEYDDTHAQNLREMLVYIFLRGYVSDTLDFKANIANFDVCFDADSYSIVLTKVDRMHEIVKKIQMYHYRKFIKENIIQSLTDVYPQLRERIYEFYDGEYIGLIICHNDIFDLEKGMCKVQDILKDKLGITLSVCIGDQVAQLDMLPDSYRTVCTIMNQIKLCEYGYLITENDYKEKPHNFKLNQFEKNLRVFVIEQRYDEINNLIDEIFSNRQIFYTEIIYIYMCTIKVLTDIANEKNCVINVFVDADMPLDKLNDFNTVTDVREYLKDICKEISRCVEEVILRRNKTYEKIMEYISRNYTLNIGLQDMADEFGFSKSYFSRYLKEVTGKNYIELLNGYRIERAKELIDSDSNLKLFRVAELVGFVSYRTFSEAFKKFEGQSPEMYKRNI